MKQDMRHVIFNYETRTTPDGPDGRAKEWILTGNQRHQRVRTHRGGGSVVIFDNKIIGHVKVPEGRVRRYLLSLIPRC